MLIRESIIAWVYAQLKTIPQVNAFRNLTSRPEKFPALVLYDGTERREDDAVDTSRISMNLEVEAWVQADTEDALGPALNALLEQLSQKLFADITAGGKAIDTRYVGIDQPTTDKTRGAKPLMGAIFVFEVDYWVGDLNLSISG